MVARSGSGLQEKQVNGFGDVTDVKVTVPGTVVRRQCHGVAVVADAEIVL